MNLDEQIYLLATCGNDSLVKLWHIIISNESSSNPDSTSSSNTGTRYKEKKSLTGHGGNVMCVRFSPIHGEVLGSVATDRTARIWSVVSNRDNLISFNKKHEKNIFTRINTFSVFWKLSIRPGRSRQSRHILRIF